MQWDSYWHSNYKKNSQESDFVFYKLENDEWVIERLFKIIIADFCS